MDVQRFIANLMSHRGTLNSEANCYSTHKLWSEEMKQLAIVLAIGATALLGGSAANASDNAVKVKAAAGVSQPSTDISSRGRHYGHYRHYGYRNYRPYYGNSYGYAPRPYYGGGYGGGYGQPYYGGGGYGYGGPSISFGFGGGRGW
jgi:hypothetical protein